MARNMTKVQREKAIRFGSAKFEVGETVEDLVDLGAMRGIEFEETWEEYRTLAYNGETFIVTADHQINIRGELMEFDLEKLALLRGGMDKIEEVKAATRFFTGGLATQPEPRVIRLTNYNEHNEEFVLTVFKAVISSGISSVFPGSSDGDPLMLPIAINGTIDATREDGMQLFMIEDGQR